MLHILSLVIVAAIFLACLPPEAVSLFMTIMHLLQGKIVESNWVVEAHENTTACKQTNVCVVCVVTEALTEVAGFA